MNISFYNTFFFIIKLIQFYLTPSAHLLINKLSNLHPPKTFIFSYFSRIFPAVNTIFSKVICRLKVISSAALSSAGHQGKTLDMEKLS